MIDYNDGKWHGWNGGECPVHPESVVEYVWHYPKRGETGVKTRKAGYDVHLRCPDWRVVIMFRVVTPYKPKPKEVTIDGIRYREVVE
jgi:transposase